jgi:hypothetical protein
VGLERCPHSVVSTTEELLQRKSSGSGLENRDYGRVGSAALTTLHPFIPERYGPLADSGHGVRFVCLFSYVSVWLIF